jgi:hypothetical protein
MFFRPFLLFVLAPFANAALTYKGVDVRKIQAQDIILKHVFHICAAT